MDFLRNVIRPDETEVPMVPKAANNNIRPELSMQAKVGARLAEIRNSKVANDNEPSKAEANDNNETVLSTSGKVEVASTASRLDALRRALSEHAANDTRGEAEVARKAPVNLPVAEAEVAEVKAAKVPEKAIIPQYSDFSGIDINRLPRNVPEARAVTGLLEINKLEAETRNEIADLQKFNENASKVMNYIKSQNFTGMSGEYFDRVIDASNKKISESEVKAEKIAKNAHIQIEEMKAGIGEVNPNTAKVFETIFAISGRTEGKLPSNYKGGHGGKFWLANGGGKNVISSLITGLSTPKEASAKKTVNDNHAPVATAA